MQVGQVEVMLDTAGGSIGVVVEVERAPGSAAAFLRLVDDGSFARCGAFYRTVRSAINDHGTPPIDVVQGGLYRSERTLSAIEHESTSKTGLRHLDGTISLARGPLGSATGAAFFICVGDQLALDARGGRTRADDEGFAAFGHVVSGMEVIRRIHEMPTSSSAADPYLVRQLLDPPVRIVDAMRTLRRG